MKYRVTVGGKNFKITYRLANQDLRATNGVDSINLSPDDLTTTVAETTALAANTDMTITGTQSITIPTASCTDVTHFCAYTAPDSGYAESDTSNNWHCLYIADRISCDTGEDHVELVLQKH